MARSASARPTGLTELDFLVRIAFTKGKLAPFLGAGYSTLIDNSVDASGTTTGYMVFGGLRFDLSRTDKLGVTLLAEAGLRYYSGFSTSDSHDALAVPLMDVAPDRVP